MTEHPTRRGACGTLLHLQSQSADLTCGAFRLATFLNLSTRAPVLVLSHGAVDGPAPLLARVHSSCMTSERFGGCDCDCAGQLDAAFAAIAEAGRGVLFYLLQEGRGAGLVAKARDRMMVQASQNRVDTFDAYARMGLGRDYRRYDEVAFAAAALGITAPLRLMTNNPEKLAALARAGIAIADSVPLRRAPSPFNLHYLAAKSRSGHTLADPIGTAATLPEPVAYFDPAALAERPRFLHMAAYLLPIRTGSSGAADWFWLHVFHDLRHQREHVILRYRHAAGAPAPLLRIEQDGLLARFPWRTPTPALRWRRAAARIAHHGAGCALFPFATDASTAAAPDPAGVVAGDADLVWLLARQLGDTGAALLIDDPAPTPAARALGRALAAEQVTLSFAPAA